MIRTFTSFPTQLIIQEARRSLSVLAWGDNERGQCGIETSTIITRPTVITELHGTQIQSLSAGSNHSMAVTRRGDVFSWGSDSRGQLGLGGSLCQSFPSRIESLAHREAIKGVSLAEGHSLFLGNSGSLWTCGDNKEGACGIQGHGSLAHPPPSSQVSDFSSKRDQVIASRRVGVPSSMSSSSSGMMFREGTSATPPTNSLNAMISQREKAISLYLRQILKPKVSQEVMDYRTMMMPFLVTNGKRRSSLGGLSLGPWSAIDPKMNQDVELLTHPSHILSPLRALTDEPGLVGQTFVYVSASSSYSLGCTGAGEVWSWGEGRGPRPLDSDLAKEIGGLGGAVKVAASLNFSLALTSAGKVVAWSTRGGKGFTLESFPSISEMVTGSKHALLTDGGRVWSISQSLDGEGVWQSPPEQVLDLSNQGGVASMSCGLNSCAVASGDGSLYLWGSLLDPDHAHNLIKKKRGMGQDQPALNGDEAVVKWSGFGGSKRPTKIDCLSHLKVTQVALGSHHALASVE